MNILNLFIIKKKTQLRRAWEFGNNLQKFVGKVGVVNVIALKLITI